MRAPGFLLTVPIFLAVSLMAPRPAVAGKAPDAELFGKVIRRIEFREETNQPLQVVHYDRSIGLKPGTGVLTRTGLKGAIQALYDTGSFSEIAADAEADGDGVLLRFQVRLSTYFNRFILPGSVDLGGRSPSEVMPLPAGERFTGEKLEAARLAVLNYMHERGYYQAQVKVHTQPGKSRAQVDTVFDVQQGPLSVIRSLAIQGVPDQELVFIRERLGVKEGEPYRRDRIRKRLDELKNYLVGRGFLDAEPVLSETYREAENSIALALSISNFGQVRLVIEGYKIPKEQQRRLLPILSGEGLRQDLIDEGAANLKTYLEDRGYPEAVISVHEDRESSGVRILRYSVDRGRKVTVSEVLFRGNRLYTAQDLLKSIQIQPARFLQKSAYSVTKLDSDVEALQSRYRSAGYLNAVVVPLVEPLQGAEKLRIIFEIEEGVQALTRSVKIEMTHSDGKTVEVETPSEGNPSLGAVLMRLKKGQPYSPSIAEHDRQIILAAYSDAGYLQPEVTYRAEGPDAEQKYAVEFQIKEGVCSRVDNVIVLGQNRTRESVIDRRIKLKPDDPLSLGKMLETQQGLYSTGVFELVRVTPQNPEGNALYQNVLVRVQEARPVTVRYGFGYQEREKVRGILALSDLNLLGLGRRVDLSLRGSAIEQAGVLSFQQPQVRFLPVDSYLTFSGSKKQEVSFDVRRVDGAYQYSRSINDHTWGLLRYRFTNVLVSNASADLIREETPRNLSTVSAIYVNDTRDNYLDPEKGFFTSTDLSITSKLPRRLLPGGHYFSLFTQNSYYRRLTGPLLMASSLRFGILHPFAGDRSIPISERFFAGGGSTLRGFDTDLAGPLGLNNEPIGGNALLIGNLELRVPLVSRLELAAFYDGGNVFTSVSAIRLSDVSHTVGIGLRVKTPFGPIRVDYGINLNLSAQLRSLGYKQGHFFLTIGPPF